MVKNILCHRTLSQKGREACKTAHQLTYINSIGELTPFLKELPPKYYLAQQQYKKQLKDKFRCLLATGREIINHGMASLLGSLDPMPADVFNNATTELDGCDDVNSRRGLIGTLLPPQRIKNIHKSDINEKYLRYVGMLNELVTSLSRESRKFDTSDEVYECEDSSMVREPTTFIQEPIITTKSPP